MSLSTQNTPWAHGCRNPPFVGPQQSLTQQPIVLQPSPQLQKANQPPPQLQLPAQPILNHNKKLSQHAYVFGFPFYPTYSISSLECQDIHLRSKKTTNQRSSPINIDDYEEEDPIENTSTIQPLSLNSNKNKMEVKNPPFLERLNISNPPTQP